VADSVHLPDLVLPLVLDPLNARWFYLLVAETFAPAAECALFWAGFGKRELLGTRSMWRDFAAITVANLAGEWFYAQGWLS
jgi:hypothetical protein